MIFSIGSLMKRTRSVYVWETGKWLSRKVLLSFIIWLTDIHEDHNVAAENPDIVKKMVGIIHQQHTENPNFKVTLPATM